MKIQYKLGLLAVGLLAVTSCAKHDPIADSAEIGQPVPTCFWSVGSTACKAGENFTFTGKYYTEPEYTPDHSEVWYSVIRSESAAATAKLAGTGLAHNKTVVNTTLVRESQCIATFAHNEEYKLEGLEEYQFNGEVGTSTTLAPVDWKNASVWEQNKFNAYYPKGFDKEFCAEVIEALTKDSTYYNALRTVYINYSFTNEQFAEINTQFGTAFPTDIKIDAADPGAAIADKSDRWYDTGTSEAPVVVGYYYKTVDANGNTVIVECGTSPVEGQNCFEVYEAAPWVFSRYDDDAGAIVRAVRAEYIPAFKALLAYISFPEWIYDEVEGKYTTVFTRTYSLDAQFKVYDNVGNVGTAADTRTISIN